MVSTFSPNIQLEEPARGDQVGTWDTPVNNNMTLLDLVVGGVTRISLNNSPVVLSAAQYQSKTLIFQSTLTGNVTITFPTSFSKSYEIYNQCTGSSAFTITLQTTAGGLVVCAPPGEIVDVVNLGSANGGTMFFKNLGRIGDYWDYAGSSVPNWVSGCSVPPYLACTGGTFSATTYPQLAVILGSTTLPDSQGRTRFALDGGTARLSSAVAGFNPNTIGAGGGSQNPQAHSHNIFISDPGHIHGTNANTGNTTTGGGGFGCGLNSGATINSAFTGISATSSSAGTGQSGNIPPAYIGGIVLMRAG
jgi:hypothetical protein